MPHIFITGSSDGLGLLAAKELISQGHQVVLHARNANRAKDTRKQIPNAKEIVIGDFDSLEETKSLAYQLNEIGTFDVVIHNAGIYTGSGLSRDGYPKLFAINVLAPFVLTALMNRSERYIYLSSQMQAGGRIDKHLLKNLRNGTYSPSYSDTKLYDLMIAFAIARKWPECHSNAVDPGWVPTKMGGKHAPDDVHEGYKTQVWLATSNEKEALVTGKFFRKKKQRNSHADALSVELQDELIRACEELSGMKL